MLKISFLALTLAAAAVVPAAKAQEQIVPEVEGLQLAEASALLHRYDDDDWWQMVVNKISTDDHEPGIVFQQSPSAGSLVAAGAEIRLSVAVSTVWIAVDDFIGKNVEEVTAWLQARELQAIIKTKKNGEYQVGEVFQQSPAADEIIPEGSKVELTIAIGEEEITVPDLTGDDIGSATTRLHALGLFHQIIEETASESQADIVLRQQPTPGVRVPGGMPVILTVAISPESAARSPERVVVDDVVGQPLARAEQILVDADLTTEIITKETSDALDGTVLAQNPKAGDSVAAGTPIRLEVAVFTGTIAPDITSLPIHDALDSLRNPDLKLVIEEEIVTERVGTVITQNPPPRTAIAPGTPLRLTVGVRPRTTVPNLVSLNLREAEAAAISTGLQVNIVEQKSEEPSGTVISQWPLAAGVVEVGAPIRLTVAASRWPVWLVAWIPTLILAGTAAFVVIRRLPKFRRAVSMQARPHKDIGLASLSIRGKNIARSGIRFRAVRDPGAVTLSHKTKSVISRGKIK